ncbi:acyltransferase [Flavobacterium sp. NRK1]|uniref:acyltransferase n=1 Tax=Flavobacterium sp. NRK1 TaxID=2954929 RepID=UPI0020937067|nr:acyltransferase family protein [Flavobacterium sp. NRK1]MCO6148339.1 acyltransferase family protein [Flavobacterium sp. NRK1]
MNKIEWVDTLRVIATISVILLHVAAPGVVSLGTIEMYDWNVANIFDSSVRFCVPVFVMITGIFLLNKDYDIKDFVTNKLFKIIIPFLFFSIIYILYTYGIQRIYNFDLKDLPSYALKSIVHGSYYHLWYIYMLIGLYLITPILRIYTKNATKNNLKYFLILWFIFNSVNNYSLNSYFPNFQISIFANYTGFYILGFYLSKYNTITFIQGLILYISGTIITIAGTYYFAVKDNYFNEMFYSYQSFNIILQSIGIYIIIFKSDIRNKLVKTTVNLLSKHSFNIYLIHALILSLLITYGMTWDFISPTIGILTSTIVCLLLSLLTSVIIKSIPGLNKYL